MMIAYGMKNDDADINDTSVLDTSDPSNTVTSGKILELRAS